MKFVVGNSKSDRNTDPLIDEEVNSVLAQLKIENIELRRQLLELNDLLIGLRAQIEEQTHRAQLSHSQYEDHLKSIYSSWSWRVGKFVVSPMSTLKRRLRQNNDRK